ncbi:hypothetical protein EZ428_18575 [Pedobacter frigiditerrae]|uniref:Uncharacterized protein n=1 Tax=Pedobacter frigiditerrae TaxID=2530452 RepID=A0A4R0MPR8_9SPHI|nr:hypothetical protein [Pedobacter frigiditerrae]TCC88643.1 hypothetical protein EZ428_18575 [Pedobacter frigiditerrae]
MNKFPFTSAGLTDLLTQLFALPDAELQVQADAIGNDFRGFTVEHFELSATQVNFLNSLDERFVTTAARDCKDFVQRRKMIGLIKEETPAGRNGTQSADGDDRGKLLDLDKAAVSSFSEEEGFQESERLNFVITYPIQN